MTQTQTSHTHTNEVLYKFLRVSSETNINLSSTILIVYFYMSGPRTLSPISQRSTGSTISRIFHHVRIFSNTYIMYTPYDIKY